MTDVVPAPTASPSSPTAPTAPTPSDVPPAGDPGTVLGNAGPQDPPAPSDTPPAPAPVEPVAPTAPALPEKYEFTLDGLTIDPEVATAADPVLRELGLSQEAAGKLLPVAKQIVDRAQTAFLAQLQDGAAAQKKAWHDAFVADPQIGGANRERTEQQAAKGLDALGYTRGHAFREVLDASGFGNHPDMIRAFARLGELVGEDGTFVRSQIGAADTRPVWERMYPNG